MAMLASGVLGVARATFSPGRRSALGVLQRLRPKWSSTLRTGETPGTGSGSGAALAGAGSVPQRHFSATLQVGHLGARAGRSGGGAGSSGWSFDAGRFSFKRAPLFWGTAIATVKTSLADLLVQTKIEGKEWHEIDWRRNFVFLTFGFGYLGLGMYAAYVKGFGRLFGPRMAEFCAKPVREKLKDAAGLRMLATQVFLDVAVLNPIFYWPCYYSFKALCFADASDPRSAATIVADTVFREYPKTMFEDNAGMGLFWIPANAVIYAVPLHYRLPLNHTVSLAWCCVLSIWRGEGDSAAAPVKEPVQQHSLVLSASS